MKVFVHRAKSGGMDGWGRDLPPSVDNLGFYATEELAKEAKTKRDNGPREVRSFDIGYSWIEQVHVQGSVE